MTVFGDVVSQHGDWVWLGSLIESLEGLGFSERLVRTSVYRLVKEDWLQVKKVGRKSYYAITESASHYYIKAARRIYSSSHHTDEDNWLILLPSFVDEQKMPELKKQLKWLGFSLLAPGIYAHPHFDQTSLEETVRELELSDSVVIFSSRTIDKSSSKVLKKIVFQKWGLDNLQMRYEKFVTEYNRIKILLIDRSTMQQAFFIRILLIHEYRRILLNDHELSADMLPENWQGNIANKLVQEIYTLITPLSNTYICSSLENMDGYLPKAIDEFNQRF